MPHTLLFYSLLTILLLCLEHASQLCSYYIPKPPIPLDEPYARQCVGPDINSPLENVTILMLARNSEIDREVSAIVSLENQFHGEFHYPVLFLNFQPWDNHFIDSLINIAVGKVDFYLISNGLPRWNHVKKARADLRDQQPRKTMCGGLKIYHHMCRFNAGWNGPSCTVASLCHDKIRILFGHEELKPCKWYWRFEPGVRFTCIIC